MAKKITEYPDLPDMSGNQVWDNNSAVRLKIKMSHIKQTYGERERILVESSGMTPEELMLCAQMASAQNQLESMKNITIEEAAKNENGIAMLLLAQDYLTKGDKDSAMEWAQRAEMNMVLGVYGFEGYLHLMNKDDDEHLEKAKECFEVGVSAADPISMRYLGYMYKFGLGVEKDVALSDDLLKCAIAIGDQESEKILNIK